jgi:hypothetical protein
MARERDPWPIEESDTGKKDYRGRTVWRGKRGGYFIYGPSGGKTYIKVHTIQGISTQANINKMTNNMAKMKIQWIAAKDKQYLKEMEQLKEWNRKRRAEGRPL